VQLSAECCANVLLMTMVFVLDKFISMIYN